MPMGMVRPCLRFNQEDATWGCVGRGGNETAPIGLIWTPHPALLMAQAPTSAQRGAVQVLAPALHAVGMLPSG